jgi:SH3-like domain-containing protein
MLGWLVVASAAVAAEQRVGASGLPLPRYVSLNVDEVNVRTGPGRQYPIRFVLVRRDLPVRIEDEFDTWRQIVDAEGDEGWVHSSLLASKRTVQVMGHIQDLKRSPEADARVVLRAEPGVLGDLVECQNRWCEVTIDERRGWIEASALWGLLPEEGGH